VRVDDGIESGAAVSPYYDPMLAKVIAWGQDRPEAIRKLDRALRQTVVLGVTTNIPYLRAILAHPAFVAGQTSTNFLAEHMPDWTPPAETSAAEWVAAAAWEALGAVGEGRPAAEGPQAVYDPWATVVGWRNGD
jgi:acetyl/propionyl-CoA carboxylase alpha subunit